MAVLVSLSLVGEMEERVVDSFQNEEADGVDVNKTAPPPY